MATSSPLQVSGNHSECGWCTKTYAVKRVKLPPMLAAADPLQADDVHKANEQILRQHAQAQLKAQEDAAEQAAAACEQITQEYERFACLSKSYKITPENGKVECAVCKQNVLVRHYFHNCGKHFAPSSKAHCNCKSKLVFACKRCGDTRSLHLRSSSMIIVPTMQTTKLKLLRILASLETAQ